MNGSVEPSRGVMRAAIMVPLPLTAISSCSGHPIGPTCLNHSTLTRSERRTTIGQRSNSAFPRPCHQSEFHECESHAPRGPMSRGLAPVCRGSVASRNCTASPGGGKAFCRRATSASICSSWRHGWCLLAIFQLTTVTANSSSSGPVRILLHVFYGPSCAMGATPLLGVLGRQFGEGRAQGDGGA